MHSRRSKLSNGDTATQDFLEKLAATRWDIPAFAALLGLLVHPGQERFFRAVLRRDNSGYRASALFIYLASGNRAGKTLALAILILHAMVFKLGLPMPDGTDKGARLWNQHPWHAWHFGLQQEVADLTRQAMETIIKGTHPAQGTRGCPMADVFGPKWAEVLKEGSQGLPYIRLASWLGGAQAHFRTTTEKGLGQLGKEMNFISYDECGFDHHLHFIVNEVFHFRRLATGGQIVLISTPSEAFGEFKDIFEQGDPSSPEKRKHHMAVRMSTRENVGFGISAVELARIIESMPEHLIAQNVDGFFLRPRSAFFDTTAVEACFDPELDEHEDASVMHRYVIGVDPAITRDDAWLLTLDYTDPDNVIGVDVLRMRGLKDFGTIVQNITNKHNGYNRGAASATTSLDVTGMGKAFRSALKHIHPIRNVEFGGSGKAKQKLLTDLKQLIEAGRIKFPAYGDWLVLRKQLINYRLDDSRLETDGVMALACATKQVVYTPTAGMVDSSARFDMFRDDQDYAEDQPEKSKRRP